MLHQVGVSFDLLLLLLLLLLYIYIFPPITVSVSSSLFMANKWHILKTENTVHVSAVVLTIFMKYRC